jgi:hypothetical protein
MFQSVFWLFRARALVCLYLFRAFFGSCGDNHTAKDPRDVSVRLVHLGRGTLQIVWALIFSCVSLLSMPRLLPWRVYWKE